MDRLYYILYVLYWWLKRTIAIFRHKNTFLYPYLLKVTRAYNKHFSFWLNHSYRIYLTNINKALSTESLELSEEGENSDIIVSLTTFPQRIDTVFISIETIMRGTIKPNRIILWLAEEQFPEKNIDLLPQTIQNLVHRGLEVRFCKDLKSHKKYYYSIQENPNCNIILIDDDIFYPLDTIEKLLFFHKLYPKDIIAVSAQQVPDDYKTRPSLWEIRSFSEKRFHSLQEQAFTGCGTLIPPHSLPEIAFDLDLIKNYAWTVDDLWLYAMARSNEVYTTVINPYRGMPVSVSIPNNISLFSQNGKEGANLNDKYWSKIQNFL